MHPQTWTYIRTFSVALALLAALFPAAPSRGADAEPDELAKVQGQWER